jgi:hypothetical protein
MRQLNVKSNPLQQVICSALLAFGLGGATEGALWATEQAPAATAARDGEAVAGASRASGGSKSQADETLTNDAIVELVKLGLGEGPVVDKIKASSCNFDVTIDGLKRLKAASVPDTVISAMIAASKGKAGPLVENPGDPNDPKSPHEAGIYYYEEASGKPKLTKLEPAVYSQHKGGVAIFARYGQTAESKAVLHPAHAVLQSTARKPVFYFYFENTKSGLGETRNIATSPNEFVLAQMEFKEKDNLRSLVTGQMNLYSGTQWGPKDQSIRALDFEKLAPGMYRVTPKQDLANGEYCLFYGGNSIFGTYTTTSGGKVFDFGVQGSTDTEPMAEGHPQVKEKKKGSK